MTRSFLALLIVLGLGLGVALPPLPARAALRGSGVARQETRALVVFSEVAVDRALHVDITVAGEQRVEVRGDDNLVPLVRTTVHGERLTVDIDPQTAIEPRLPLLVRITVPRLITLEVSGASDVDVRGRTLPDLYLAAHGASRLRAAELSGSVLNVLAQGASQVTLKGQSRAIKATISGASELRARDVTTEVAQVSGDGASRLEVCARKLVEVTLDGASHADFFCGPAEVKQHLSGASSLNRH